MFTGIIESVGEVKSLQAVAGDWRLQIKSATLDFSDIKFGDSISVSGVCLTVTAFGSGEFSADVSNETIACTSMAQLAKGDLVNLEKAMLPTSRFGGHIVSGHVDGLARLISKTNDGRSECLLYKVPAELARYIAHKGSVCLDGVSLTVNEVNGDEFSVNIIPHTSTETTIGHYQPGCKVNLEVDVISRYLERLMHSEKSTSKVELSMELLQESGFVK